MLAAHDLSYCFHKKYTAHDFDSKTLTALYNSLLKHVNNNKSLCAATFLFTYSMSLVVQVGNDSVGYLMTNQNQSTTYAQTIQSGATGVGYMYTAFFILHHAAALAAKKLTQHDQNVLKHLLTFAHDFVSCFGYTSVGETINKQTIKYAINLGSLVITLMATMMILVAEKIDGRSVVTVNDCKKFICFSKKNMNNLSNTSLLHGNHNPPYVNEAVNPNPVENERNAPTPTII